MKNLVFNFFLTCLMVVLAVVVYTLCTFKFEGFIYSGLLAMAIIVTIVLLPTKFTGLVK